MSSRWNACKKMFRKCSSSLRKSRQSCIVRIPTTIRKSRCSRLVSKWLKIYRGRSLSWRMILGQRMLRSMRSRSAELKMNVTVSSWYVRNEAVLPKSSTNKRSSCASSTLKSRSSSAVFRPESIPCSKSCKPRRRRTSKAPRWSLSSRSPMLTWRT